MRFSDGMLTPAIRAIFYFPLFAFLLFSNKSVHRFIGHFILPDYSKIIPTKVKSCFSCGTAHVAVRVQQPPYIVLQLNTIVPGSWYPK